jgi:imidazolonepropionase-like amidohydrolase
MAQEPRRGPERLLLAGGRVFDPDSGEAGPGDVVLADGRIHAVGSDLDGDEAIDCSGLTLVPGLIDCHAHMAFAGLDDPTFVAPSYRLLAALPGLQRSLELGVTTVRDAWGADAGLRDAIADGLVVGPRLLVSLVQVCGTGGIGDHFGIGMGELDGFIGTPSLPRGVFDGPDEARGVVRRMVRSGADVIKVTASGSATRTDARNQHVAPDELDAVVAEATRHARHVMVHAHGARAAEHAARAGARSIEHGFFLDEAAVAALVEHGTWLVPTLLAVLGDEPRDDLHHEAAQGARASFALALDAGVRIAMGTDCPATPHERRLEELTLMGDLGMAPRDVWRAATTDAADLLDRDDLGRLRPGATGDVVAIRGSLDDLHGLADRIAVVCKDGRRVR